MGIEPRKFGECKNLLTGEKFTFDYYYVTPSSYLGLVLPGKKNWAVFDVRNDNNKAQKFFKGRTPCMMTGQNRSALFIVESHMKSGQLNLTVQEKTPLEMSEIIDRWVEDKW